MKRTLLILLVSALAGLGAGYALQKTGAGSAQEPPQGPMVNVGPRGGYDAQIEGKDYWAWLQNTELPVVRGYAARGLEEMALEPWPEAGGSAAFLDLSDYKILNAYVIEIPPGATLEPIKHLYEELIVVLNGQGYTRLGNTSEMPQRVEWQADSMFAPPLNAYHQHINTDPEKPARLLGVTTAPLVMGTFANDAFIFNTEFQFTDRFDEDEPFLIEPRDLGNRIWRMNLVKNLKESEAEAWDARGKGSASRFWEMSDNVMMQPHISDIPVERYKHAHRHKHEAYIYIVSGKGYSLIWPHRGAERIKVDWEEGDIFAIPLYWYHQHFNLGETRARYLAIHNPPWMRRFNLEWRDQIDPEDEDPAIRVQYEEELRKAKAERQASD